MAQLVPLIEGREKDTAKKGREKEGGREKDREEKESDEDNGNHTHLIAIHSTS